MKKILITGANSFIGRHLSQKLQLSGYYVIGIGTSPKPKNLKLNKYISTDFEYSKNLQEIDCDTKTVYHLASVTEHNKIMHCYDFTQKKLLTQINNLLKHLQKLEIEKFIFTSSGKVYGAFNNKGYKENDIIIPNTKLGKIKKTIEDAIIKNFNNLGIQIIIARIFNVFGPKQKNSFVIPYIFSQLNKSQIFLGNLSHKRDYLFISDVIEALICLKNYQSKNNVEIFNVGSGKGTSVREILNIIEKIYGKTLNIKIENKKLRNEENILEFCNNSKIKSLSWEQKISLREGLIIYKKQLEIEQRKSFGSDNLSWR